MIGQEPNTNTWEKVSELGGYEKVRGRRMEALLLLPKGAGSFLLNVLMGDVRLDDDIEPIKCLEDEAIKMAIRMGYFYIPPESEIEREENDSNC